jgi:O-antigen ligase
MLRRVRVELGLALVLALLSMLSVINSDDPIRILRILFPSALPILLFLQLVALREVSPDTVERLPRVFFAAGVSFACLPLLLTFASGGIHEYFFEGGYRFMGMFDHESQLSVMIAVLVPLAIAEIAIAEKPLMRWVWIVLLILVFYTLVRVGSKTALFITLGYAWLFYIWTHLRIQSYLKNVFLISVVAVVMLFLALYGTSIATAIDPVLGEKVAAVFDDGIENYRTIQSRNELWAEAIRQGQQHWLVGTGAGEMILGLQHAHNLVLDYFRGIGIFGALAIVLLCLRILWRAVDKAFRVLFATNVTSRDLRIFACYASAAVYVTCNQLSNSFGPATISALWMIYLPAVLSEPVLSRSVSRNLPLRLRTNVG